MDMITKCKFTVILLLMPIIWSATVQAAPEEKVDASTRCSVCGMFVAKYDNWLSQIRLADDTVMFFDGVKDMMVFYLKPGKYSKAESKDVKEIWVKDYYNLTWVDGRNAFYVIGSDVYGPMGKEFIPFADEDAAKSFLQDHKGQKIVIFDDITEDLVESMRTGTKMRHGDQ